MFVVCYDCTYALAAFLNAGNKCQSNKSSHLVFPDVLASRHGELSPVDVCIQGDALGRDERVSASRPEVGGEEGVGVISPVRRCHKLD